MGLSLLAFCLLMVFTATTEAFKFGFPSRFMPQQISQTTSTKGRDTVKSPPVERKLEDITVDQTRQLVDISDSTFCQAVLNNEGLTIVLFTSSWCGPCRQMQQTLGEVMGNYNKKSRFCSIDTDHNPDSAAEFQVRSIPSTLFFKHGKLVSEIVGSVPQSVVISQIIKHTA